MKFIEFNARSIVEIKCIWKLKLNVNVKRKQMLKINYIFKIFAKELCESYNEETIDT